MSTGASGVQPQWEKYRAAVQNLLEPSVDYMLLEVSDADEYIERALAASQELGDAIAARIGSDDSEEHEVAALQVNAAAVVDLSVADYLAALPDGANEQRTNPADPERAKEVALRQLVRADPILSVGPRTWPPMLIGGAPASDPKKELEVQTARALEGISIAAADAAGEVFLKGVLGLAIGHVTAACETPLRQVFDNVDKHASRWKRPAAKFVRRAVEKLFAALGPTIRDTLDRVKEWVRDWTGEKTQALVQAWITDLYHAPVLKTELTARISNAPTTPQMTDAADDLLVLNRKFDDHMQVLRTVAWLLRKVSAWLVFLTQPWGYIGLASGYVAGTGFAVLYGGDYVDADAWILNLVPGVRTIVEAAVPPPP